MLKTSALVSETLLRKSAQEVEIDRLLAEEFSCDPSFAERFVTTCGLPCTLFQVIAAIPEPSLGGAGFGDLLVKGIAGGLKVALLIEDKVTAGPAVRQAERYAAHASWLRDNGWDRVWTVLVAPSSYRGERPSYDASIDLEEVASLLRSPDPARLSYRHGIIERALSKKVAAGVRIPDVDLHRLKSDYLSYAANWCALEDLPLNFPALRESYYDGDSWIEPIRSAALPSNVKLRHRLWTSAIAECGRVDLIVSPATLDEQSQLIQRQPAGAFSESYSNGKGLQVSFSVPEIRPRSAFATGAIETGLKGMRALVDWYLERRD